MASAGRKNALLDIALISLLWIVMTIVINPLGDFAANDDWVYGLSVEATLRNGGSFTQPSTSYTNLFLQAYWGLIFCLPFGFSYTALRFSTLVAGLAGIVFTYLTGRELGAGRRSAVLLALLLGLNPLYVQTAHSFMTDVPFIALTGISFWAFARGVRRADRRFVALAFGLALASILIRQIGLIFIVAYGVAMAIEDRWSPKAIMRLLAMAAAGVALHLLFRYWVMVTHRAPSVATITETLPGAKSHLLDSLITRPLELLPYLGLMLLPGYVMSGCRTLRALAGGHPKSFAIGTALMMAAQLLAWRVSHVRLPLFGNLINLWGMGPLTLSDSYFLQINLPPVPRFFDPVWFLLFLIGVVAGAVLAVELAAGTVGLLRRMIRRSVVPNALVADAALLVTLGYTAFNMLMSVLPGAMDRYLLVMIAPLSLWIIVRAGPAPAGRKAHIAAGSMLVVFGAFATLGVHDYSAWQRSRLAATQALMRAGVPHEQIDGGYEHNGRYLYRFDYIRRRGFSRWWVVDDLYRIGSGPMPGYRIIAHFPYRRWLTLSMSEVVILRREAALPSGALPGRLPR